MPLELEAAVERIAHGPIERVDVGEVNGRVFVNNSSLGLYPAIVHDRERQRKRLGRGKWPALVWASLGGVASLSVPERAPVGRRRRAPAAHAVRLHRQQRVPDGGLRDRRARPARRAAASASTSSSAPSRLRLLLLALRALVGRLKQARDFEAMLASEIVVESRHRRLRVATDGEITLMAPPLRYRIRPASAARGRRHARRRRRRPDADAMRTLVHLSDLHFGRIDPTLIEPLLATVAALAPARRRRLGRPDAARPRGAVQGGARLPRPPAEAADRRAGQPRRAALPRLGALLQPARQVQAPHRATTSSRASSTPRSRSSASTRRAR